MTAGRGVSPLLLLDVCVLCQIPFQTRSALMAAATARICVSLHPLASVSGYSKGRPSLASYDVFLLTQVCGLLSDRRAVSLSTASDAVGDDVDRNSRVAALQPRCRPVVQVLATWHDLPLFVLRLEDECGSGCDCDDVCDVGGGQARMSLSRRGGVCATAAVRRDDAKGRNFGQRFAGAVNLVCQQRSQHHLLWFVREPLCLPHRCHDADDNVVMQKDDGVVKKENVEDELCLA